MSPAANKGKIAGVALIAIAAAALIAGIVTAVSSSGSANQAARGHGSPSASSLPASTTSHTVGTSTGHSGSHTTAASATTAPSTTSTRSGPTTTVIAAPPAGSGEGARQAAQRRGVEKSAPVRVYNNSTIKGLASRAAADIRADGFQVVQVGNYSGGVIPTTTVYYRRGTAEKATAESLGRAINARVAPRFAGIKNASPGVILIVTKDYRGTKDP